MSGAEEKRASSYGAYPEEIEFLNSLKENGEKSPDILAMVVEDYKSHQLQTHGQRAAEEALSLINAHAVDLCKIVEGAALAAAGELRIAKEAFDAETLDLKERLEEERHAHRDDVSNAKKELLRALAKAEECERIAAERDDLKSKLAAAEVEARNLREAVDSARSAEISAKSALSDLREEFCGEVKRRVELEKALGERDQAVAELESAARLIEVEDMGKLEAMKAQLEAARKDAEHAKGSTSFVSAQADDLRKQLEEARRESEDLRSQLQALQALRSTRD